MIGVPTGNEGMDAHKASPPTHEPSDRAADFAILKADFEQRLAESKTFKSAAAVRDEVRDSDLPDDYKAGFEIQFRAKFEEKKR